MANSAARELGRSGQRRFVVRGAAAGAMFGEKGSAVRGARVGPGDGQVSRPGIDAQVPRTGEKIPTAMRAKKGTAPFSGGHKGDCPLFASSDSNRLTRSFIWLTIALTVSGCPRSTPAFFSCSIG